MTTPVVTPVPSAPPGGVPPSPGANNIVNGPRSANPTGSITSVRPADVPALTAAFGKDSLPVITFTGAKILGLFKLRESQESSPGPYQVKEPTSKRPPGTIPLNKKFKFPIGVKGRKYFLLFRFIENTRSEFN
ncbi:MAG: hypothetical protein AAFY76_17995, partial [Cyanobacteria bacterium J06649_11]